MKNYIFLLLLLAGSAKAQHFGPTAVGNYSGIHATKINPALTAYGAYNWHVNIIGAWGNVNNNYLSLHLPFSAYRFTNSSMSYAYKDENGNPEFDSSWIREHLNGSRKHAAAGAMVYGPSFTIKVKRFHLGMVTEATALARVAGMGENMAHAFYKELDTAQGAFDYFRWDANNDIKLHKTTASANAWAAVGANISYSVKMDWKKELLIGVTVKRVWGFGGGYLKHDNTIVHRVSPSVISLDHTKVEYSEYYNNGRGMGFDLGLGYVFHKPEYRQPGGYADKHPRYLCKFGLSVLDIGRIRYREAYYTSIINTNPITWDVANEKSEFQGNDPVTVADSVLSELPNMRHSNRTEYIGLPTRIAFTADYQLRKYWFINATVVQSLRSRYSIHARHQSYAMIAPRYEREFFEFSLPVFLEYDYRSIRAGASVRMGWLYFGSNSIMSMLYTRAVRDADFYIGITISDLPGKWRDRWFKEHENKKIKDEDLQDCEKM